MYGIFISVVLVLSVSTCLPCSLPSDFDGTWQDYNESGQDDVTFSAGAVSGWKIDIFRNEVSKWKCIDEDPSKQLFLFKSTAPVKVYGLDFTVYRCMKWRKEQNCLYSFTFQNDPEPNLGNVRATVILSAEESLKTFTDLCSPSDAPKETERQFISKKGC